MNLRQSTTALGVGVLALTLSGCMKLDMDLELHNDDTVDGSMIVAFTKEVTDVMGDDTIDKMLQDESSLPEGARLEEYRDGDFQGVEVFFSDTSLDEFQDADTTITHEDGEWDFTLSMDTSDEALGTGEDLGDFGDVDIRIAVTFPGEVLETNGDVDGTTVTWNPEAGDIIDLRARASETGGSSGGGVPLVLWIVVGVLVVGALIAGLFYFSRNSNGQAPAPPPPPPPPAQ